MLASLRRYYRKLKTLHVGTCAMKVKILQAQLRYQQDLVRECEQKLHSEQQKE